MQDQVDQLCVQVSEVRMDMYLAALETLPRMGDRGKGWRFLIQLVDLQEFPFGIVRLDFFLLVGNN